MKTTCFFFFWQNWFWNSKHLEYHTFELRTFDGANKFHDGGWIPLLNCNVHFWSQFTLGTFQFTVMNWIALFSIFVIFKNSWRLIDSLVISLFLDWDYFFDLLDDEVVMCAFLLLNSPSYWHSYTQGLYIKNKGHLYSILGKNLFYYPSLWLITSEGTRLVHLIPLFCGHEFKLTNSHVFINTHNLRKLYSQKEHQNTHWFKGKKLIKIYITFLMLQKCTEEQTHHNEFTFLTPMHKHTLTHIVPSVFKLMLTSWVSCLMSKTPLNWM